MTHPLYSKWLEFWNKLEAPKTKATPIFTKLEKHYSEAHRTYHSFTHVKHCLDEFDSCRPLAQNEIAIEMALWFHDAIYKIFSKKNEEDSADWAYQVCLENNKSENFAQNVKEIILATKHNKEPHSPDSKLLVDIDLAILGQNEKIFNEYEKKIRKEYKWIPNFIYKKQRNKILNFFLNRPSIYFTDFFQKKYEKQARINLLSSLKGNP